jgi:hypothetical protein
MKFTLSLNATLVCHVVFESDNTSSKSSVVHWETTMSELPSAPVFSLAEFEATVQALVKERGLNDLDIKGKRFLSVRLLSAENATSSSSSVSRVPISSIYFDTLHKDAFDSAQNARIQNIKLDVGAGDMVRVVKDVLETPFGVRELGCRVLAGSAMPPTQPLLLNFEIVTSDSLVRLPNSRLRLSAFLLESLFTIFPRELHE